MAAVQSHNPITEVSEFTDAGVGIQRRAPARRRHPLGVEVSPRALHLMAIHARLERGPFLAGFDAGLYDLRDAAPRGVDRVRLTTWGF